MKNILFIAINAKYPHTNLAVRNLNNVITNTAYKSSFVEYTINSNFNTVIDNLLNLDTEIYAFSCYIWNMTYVLKLSMALKNQKPNCTILLGGPEVSFECKELMQQNQCIDYIIYGEGEKAIVDFANYLHGKHDISLCANLVYRKNATISINERQEDTSFCTADFPYLDLDKLKNRVIYYEASRGCPFNCAFCLSSTTKGYIEKNIDIVKRDLQIFINHDIKIVKFVDRTFNANKKRAYEIIDFIKDHNKNTCFHLELSPSLLDTGLIERLNSVKKNTIQVEIGIQSTNKQTLTAINRFNLFDKFAPQIRQIVKTDNVHVHVDLIAGLPFEGLSEFARSFDDVFSLKTDNLQLGFLKLLKGSKLRTEAANYGIKYDKQPPYEFIYTDALPKEDVMLIHDIEYLLKRFYNSSLFKTSICYFAYKQKSAFEMFKKLNTSIKSHDINLKKKQEKDLIQILFNFPNTDDIAKEFLLYDMLNKRKKPKLLDYLFTQKHNVFAKKYFEENQYTSKKNLIAVHFSVDIHHFMKEDVLLFKDNTMIFDYSDFTNGVSIYSV